MISVIAKHESKVCTCGNYSIHLELQKLKTQPAIEHSNEFYTLCKIIKTQMVIVKEFQQFIYSDILLIRFHV